tara:strand:+ start:73 stop:879 length:807 start_codon:yes stop_codon:yes gene_type:complete
MKTRVETINAERAKHYLNLNRNNRPVTESKVNQYFTEIQNGKWKEDTGEAIKISKQGFIIDGQHRLLALSKTEKSLNFLIVYDLDASVFDVLDTGKNRGASDVFALNNIPNYNRTSSIIREYVSFKDNKYYKTSAKDNFKVTNASLLSVYKSDSKHFDSISNHSAVLYHSFNKIISATNLGSFYLLFNESDQVKCDDFFDQLSGRKINTNNSISVLKNTLIKDKISIKKITPRTRYAYIIKTWNAFILNKDIRILKYDDNIEKFPTIL